MKLGVISQNRVQFEFEEGLKYAHDLGLQAIEVGACGLWNQKYCDVEKLLSDKGSISGWLEVFDRNGLEISASGAMERPSHPTRVLPRSTPVDFAGPASLHPWPVSSA